MICENNRLKYCIDRKNQEILKVIEHVRGNPNLGKNEILELLDGIVDKAFDDQRQSAPVANYNQIQHPAPEQAH